MSALPLHQPHKEENQRLRRRAEVDPITFHLRQHLERPFGRDPTQPVKVTNIVSWPLPVSIKGKTIFFKYEDKFNQLDYQGTNANQGHFDLSHTEAGALPMAPK